MFHIIRQEKRPGRTPVGAKWLPVLVVAKYAAAAARAGAIATEAVRRCLCK